MTNSVTIRSIAVNGVDLIVHECGDPAAPTVLLLHGFPDLAHCWRHQMAPLAAAGFHVLAPNQRGYGHSSAPATVDAYGIDYLAGDLFALLDHYHKDDAVFVGHDWGAMVTWDAARLQPERVRAIAAVSVPYVEWRSPPTELFKAVFGDRFFYMLYFQQVGPPEAELGADPLATMARMLYGASAHGAVNRIRPSEPAPMEGTGFLTLMTEPPSLPFNGPEGPWLTAADLDVYADEFEHSGFFGPVSWYRNLDANSVRLTGLGAARLTMPCYLIWGEYDLVKAMDPKGPARMQSELPDFRGTTELAGVGHWVQQEAPNAFNEALLGFLRSL